MFASLNQMNFMKTSRKDDLISATYLLLTVLNKNELPFLNQDTIVKMETQKYFKYVKQLK